MDVPVTWITPTTIAQMLASNWGVNQINYCKLDENLSLYLTSSILESLYDIEIFSPWPPGSQPQWWSWFVREARRRWLASTWWDKAVTRCCRGLGWLSRWGPPRRTLTAVSPFIQLPVRSLSLWELQNKNDQNVKNSPNVTLVLYTTFSMFYL